MDPELSKEEFVQDNGTFKTMEDYDSNFLVVCNWYEFPGGGGDILHSVEFSHLLHSSRSIKTLFLSLIDPR